MSTVDGQKTFPLFKEDALDEVLDRVLDEVAVGAVGQVQLPKRDQPAVVLVVLREPLLEWANEEAAAPLEQEQLRRRRLDDDPNMVKACATRTRRAPGERVSWRTAAARRPSLGWHA